MDDREVEIRSADPESPGAVRCIRAYFDEPFAHHWFEKRLPTE